MGLDQLRERVRGEVMVEGDEGNHDRLTTVKRIYDPDNLFHLNQNIVPAS